MSRHEYRPSDWPHHFAFAVGFDPALEIFFAQVMDYSRGDDDNCVVVWLTPAPREIFDVDQLMEVVNQRILGILPPVRLSPTMRLRLERDRGREDKGDWLDEPTALRRRKQPLLALDFCGAYAEEEDASER